MGDLTILFLTSNKVPEQWSEYHKSVLLEAANGIPILIISRKPTTWGAGNLIDTETPSFVNFYVQLLRGAKEAKTPYIAVVEDDTLYHKDHFTCFRAPLDTFGYNMHRWSVSTWTEPYYSMRWSMVGASSVSPREEMIDALEEKLAKAPKEAFSSWMKWKIGEPGTGGEKELGLRKRKSVGFYSKTAIIQFNHDYFTNAENDEEGVKRRHRKSFGVIRATEIPFWGKAEDLIKKFK